MTESTGTLKRSKKMLTYEVIQQAQQTGNLALMRARAMKPDEAGRFSGQLGDEKLWSVLIWVSLGCSSFKSCYFSMKLKSISEWSPNTGWIPFAVASEPDPYHIRFGGSLLLVILSTNL